MTVSFWNSYNKKYKREWKTTYTEGMDWKFRRSWNAVQGHSRGRIMATGEKSSRTFRVCSRPVSGSTDYVVKVRPGGLERKRIAGAKKPQYGYRADEFCISLPIHIFLIPVLLFSLTACAGVFGILVLHRQNDTFEYA